MSEGVQAPSGPSGRFRIRNPQDFYGGLVLVAVAAFALWASRDLPGMRGFAFGPGTAPRMFAMILGALGLAVAAAWSPTVQKLNGSRSAARSLVHC